MPDNHLYPAIEPYETGLLDVEAPHRLHFEQCGNPDGIPVLFLHGGPGSGCAPGHRRFFNPEVYRIVLLDQRGAGRSQPAGSLENNNTQALLEDLERLRAHLRIDRWLLYGGSWGATLALLYARQQPRRVSGLVLRGAFLARHRDLVWFYGADGVGRLFPREYESFINHLALSARAEPVTAYNRLLTSADPAIQLAAAGQWNAWESRVIRQFLPSGKISGLPDAEILRRASIVNHFAHHNFFLDGKGVPLQLDALRELPCIMIHGQRDLVCPLEIAWTLHRALPDSSLRIIETGGHVANEAVIGEALVAAFDEMPARIGHEPPTATCPDGGLSER